jgi:phosphatidylinositol glycan class B
MSMSESSLSQASTKASDGTKDAGNGPHRTLKAVKNARRAATTHDILLFLIALRILNALTLRTFFQPDEYFQSLEPAWQIAFGKGSGAWITWVGSCCQCASTLSANSSTGMEELPQIRDPPLTIRPGLLGL